MPRAALGFQMHSGWGILVAVAINAGAVEILDRRRIVVVDRGAAGSTQPYHHAADLALADAERHITQCAAATEQLALNSIKEALLSLPKHRVTAAVVLQASGRPLPSLEKILAAHPLIHTAEGEFFRNAAKNACERLGIPVTMFPQRELEERSKKKFGKKASQVQSQIVTANRTLGPPWTKDHKTAALAAAIMLS